MRPSLEGKTKTKRERQTDRKAGEIGYKSDGRSLTLKRSASVANMAAKGSTSKVHVRMSRGWERGGGGYCCTHHDLVRLRLSVAWWSHCIALRYI
jgi:hypothetical protein